MHKLKESAVEAVAKVMGESSASAAALRNAAERRAQGQEVEFYQHGNSVLVFGTHVNDVFEPAGAKEQAK